MKHKMMALCISKETWALASALLPELTGVSFNSVQGDFVVFNRPVVTYDYGNCHGTVILTNERFSPKEFKRKFKFLAGENNPTFKVNGIPVCQEIRDRKKFRPFAVKKNGRVIYSGSRR